MILIAKAPVPGRVKTRLCPPCTPEQAAAVAHASLLDTVGAIESFGADRVVVALDGSPGPWIPEGFEVVPQVDGGLGERLAAAFAHVAGDRRPAAVVGMDTPQLSGARLREVFDRFRDPEVDAVLGRAVDGGYWTVGFAAAVLGDRAPGRGLFSGVPMSTAVTADAQLRRFGELGLNCAEVIELRDMDTWDDALVIARDHPDTRTAHLVREIAADEESSEEVG